MTIMSKAAFFRAASNSSIRRIQIGGVTSDEWDKHVEQILAQAKECGVPDTDIAVTESSITIGTKRQNKPKMPRTCEGKLQVYSANCQFVANDSSIATPWFDKKDSKLVNDGIEIETCTGSTIRYELIA